MADGPSPKLAPQRRSWSWRSRAFRGVVYQIVAVSVIALVAWFLTSNTLTNLRVRGIQSGFDFLIQPAGFGIGETRDRVRLGQSVLEGIPGRTDEHDPRRRSSAS